jgi:hypothetical protein
VPTHLPAQIAEVSLPVARVLSIASEYEQAGRYDEAIVAGRGAVELDLYDPNAYHNLAVTYYRLLQIDESIACAQQAMALDPTLAAPHFALAESLLLRGEYHAGWEEYEWRFQIPGAGKLMPKTDRPQWNGALIPDGSLLLIADQGFGDTIQFSRYIPWARQRCPHTVLACDGEMQDAVVTIDTAIAHLAAAMGKSVWIMLPYSPDWRWLFYRNTSPWYPTVHLCRQSTPRRWEPVANRIAEQLRRYLTSTAPIESAPEVSPVRSMRAVS